MSSLISATVGTIEISSTIMKNIINNVNNGGGIVMNIGNGGKLLMNESSEMTTVKTTNGNGGGMYLSQS
jgi:hypothetical protein